MATYPVINKETGEQKNVVLSVHEWDQWKDDNPEWTRDWSDPSTAPMATDVGEWRDKMSRTHPGFHDIMKNKIAPQAALGGNKSITDKYR